MKNIFGVVILIVVGLGLACFDSERRERRSKQITRLAEGTFSHVEYRHKHSGTVRFDSHLHPSGPYQNKQDITILFFEDGTSFVFDGMISNTWPKGTDLAIDEDGNGKRTVVKL